MPLGSPCCYPPLAAKMSLKPSFGDVATSLKPKCGDAVGGGMALEGSDEPLSMLLPVAGACAPLSAGASRGVAALGRT